MHIRRIIRATLAMATLTTAFMVFRDGIPDTTVAWPGLFSTAFYMAMLYYLGFVMVYMAVIALDKARAQETSIHPLAIGSIRGRAILSIDQLESTARHEAAHAVAALALGHQVIRVSTEGDAGSSMGGHCLWRHRDGALHGTLDHVVIALAGHAGQPSPQSTGVGLDRREDYADALRSALAVSMADPSASYSAVIGEAMATAQTIVDENAQAIEALAHALSREPVTISGHEVSEIIAVPNQSA